MNAIFDKLLLVFLMFFSLHSTVTFGMNNIKQPAATAIASTIQADEDNFEHHYVMVNGLRLHYVSVGKGEPVLLIPGWPQTWYTWRYVMTELAANGYMAIAVDPLGTGYSDKPESGYDTGAAGTTLHEMMKQLGHTQYSIVGHDIGMWVGYALASDYPEEVKKIALMEAVIPGLAPAPSLFVSPEENIFLWHFMFNQVRDLPEMLTAGKESEYLNFIFDNWAYRRDRVAAQTYIDAYASPGGLRAGFAYYRAIPQTIQQNKLRAQKKLTMPVLAIGADHATRDAPQLTLQGRANQLQGAMLGECGHFVTEECPEQLMSYLLPFLKQ
ncbi:alpha/beta fold hydrolase [Providencia rustigianii]|uniref:alpha/beta fold hydrolase n=1 Tax=Providencia rustigianii TaxID=158850 RepID=UPI000F720876|nr:alpha/beta hydrolase [Providencia rustigianii]MTC59245.1 alpha/beta fold hydrolase [Providencia rustigianii]VEH55727.1 Soluble epoxide hydrolase [Providencia rustigianii]